MSQSSYSFQSFIDFINNNFAILLLVGLTFIGGFAAGSVWTEKEMLRSDSVKAVAAPAADDATAPTGPTPEQLAKAPEVSKEDHVRGKANAKVTLVEYSDFECPFCARFIPTVEQVLKEYPNDVKIVYRHFPLSFHPQAQPAAEASECVAKLEGEEAFWTFHDAIFATNTANSGLTREDIFAAAVKAGADRTKVESCMTSGEMTAKVKAQMDAGSAAGIAGTPGTIVIAGDKDRELISGALPFEQVKVTIDKYLN